jgi:glycine dehydrogenase subunit 1
MDDNIAAVIVQSPNFFGIIEDISEIAKPVHNRKSLLVAGFTEATSLGILKPAGELGADFVVGEGQAFGNTMSYGGPYLGIFASTSQFLRKIPGRLAGATTDKEGRRGYVLTLQTREQHIRRERATSNICSNEALCALAAAVYLSCMGKNLYKLAELNIRKADYLKKELMNIKGWENVFSAPVYNEFVMMCPDARVVNTNLKEKGIIGGYELEQDYPELANCLLMCATEMMSRNDMDRIVGILK